MGRRRKRGDNSVHGVLCVDKPSGSSSAWLARRIGRALGTQRVGHAGTLDPFATGVLVIMLGEATKLSRWLTAHDKEYLATLQLGVETDTLDREGMELSRSPVPQELCDAGHLNEVLAEFVGRRPQKVPVFSAVRVQGKRLMHEARAGRAVEAPVRDVECFSINLIAVDPELKRVTVRMHCAKGYYVRAFARDFGRALGVGAHLVELRRVRSGPFRIEMATTIDAASAANFVPIEQALTGIEVVPVGPERVGKVRTGQPIEASATSELSLLVDSQGSPVAVVRRGADNMWRVERGLHWSLSEHSQ